MSAAVRDQVRAGRFRVHQPAGDVAEQRGRGRFQVSRRRLGAGCPSRCRRRSAGSAIGSFAYMAPERFKGTTGPEADVYSLMLAVALVAVLWVLFGHAGKIGGASQTQTTSPSNVFHNPRIDYDRRTDNRIINAFTAEHREPARNRRAGLDRLPGCAV
jgi:serine/threonine protein kinase